MILLIGESKICRAIEIPHDNIDLMKTASLISKYFIRKMPEAVKFSK